MKTEKRFQNSKIIEARQAGEGERYFEGYAAVFDQPSKLMRENGKVFVESIKREAFNEVLDNGPKVRLVVNHDSDKLLGRTESGTLELSVDDIGLKYRASVPNTTLGNDTFEQIKRGDYFESSFMFGVRPDDQVWSFNKTENVWNRELTNIPVLQDVSIVTDGAYANTDVTVAERHLKEFDENLHKAERQRRINKLKLLEL